LLVELVRIEPVERVVERDVEAARSLGLLRGLLAGDAERAVAMQPVPVTVPSSSWPFETEIVRSPSETWSTGPVTAATQPRERAASRASSGPPAPPTASTPRISAARPVRVAISAELPRTTATLSSPSRRREVSVR
jgi:hypothetical protein